MFRLSPFISQIMVYVTFLHLFLENVWKFYWRRITRRIKKKQRICFMKHVCLLWFEFLMLIFHCLYSDLHPRTLSNYRQYANWSLIWFQAYVSLKCFNTMNKKKWMIRGFHFFFFCILNKPELNYLHFDHWTMIYLNFQWTQYAMVLNQISSRNHTLHHSVPSCCFTIWI